ncbi:MAG: FAD-dependent oxidoreductase, partial [Acidimicrobiia bacterium]|nr:FAD-dependent oxidoreductase [Acidimicrobiia bacterium]
LLGVDGGAAPGLRHRAMVLAWLVLDQPRWTEFDAHYLPDPAHPVARLSEPRNYRESADDPAGVTVLCAEIPCWEGDATWTAGPDAIGATVAAALAGEGLPPVRPVAVELAHLPRVYPLYPPGFERSLAATEAAVARAGAGRVVTLGRQGLFAPDNTHHVMAMGRAAAAGLRPDGSLDAARWSAARADFHGHVVED